MPFAYPEASSLTSIFPVTAAEITAVLYPFNFSMASRILVMRVSLRFMGIGDNPIFSIMAFETDYTAVWQYNPAFEGLIRQVMGFPFDSYSYLERVKR